MKRINNYLNFFNKTNCQTRTKRSTVSNILREYITSSSISQAARLTAPLRLLPGSSSPRPYHHLHVDRALLFSRQNASETPHI